MFDPALTGSVHCQPQIQIKYIWEKNIHLKFELNFVSAVLPAHTLLVTLLGLTALVGRVITDVVFVEVRAVMAATMSSLGRGEV